MTTHDTRWSPVLVALGLLVLCVLGIALGSAVGSTGFESWFAAMHDDIAWQIVWDIRLPRSVGACAAGALLGLAGALAQGLFRNPLADPYLLGSASGASLGVAVALALFGGNPFATEFLVRLGLTGAAFVGAVLAVMLTLVLARGVQHTLRLLLAGVIVGVTHHPHAPRCVARHAGVFVGLHQFHRLECMRVDAGRVARVRGVGLCAKPRAGCIELG
jgi:iron complex transport system permease protein